jgi:hypothetical protein
MSWRATLRGTAVARHNPRLVVTLCLFNLALALAAGLPGWLTLSSVMGPLPGADALGEAFRFGVLADLSEIQPGLVSGFGRAALAAFGLGLIVALATTGGTLEVLTSGDERSFAHRFGRGAGRFFLRFLRLGLITLVTAPLATGLAAAPLLALSRHLRRESGSECWRSRSGCWRSPWPAQLWSSCCSCRTPHACSSSATTKGGCAGSCGRRSRRCCGIR